MPEEARPRIVVLGGGTGIFAVLRGLGTYNADITAIVSMSDNGGSSGRLRDEFGYLPPGDARSCLVALAGDDEAPLLRELFEYQFDRGQGLNGHKFGDLLITALTDILGSAHRAIEEAGRLLDIRGTVVPVTIESTTLCANLENGHRICGETDIDIRKSHHGVPIADVFLEPSVAANPDAVAAIEVADLIVLGPGDLYTSVIPNLLVDGIPEAIRDAAARCVYVCNIMTKRGETDGFAASDFIRQINRYIGGARTLDVAVLNYHESLPSQLYDRYKAERSEPVSMDLARCYENVPQLVIRPLTAAGGFVRHDPSRLAEILMSLVPGASQLRTVGHGAAAS
ncbi:MAG TPA: hypothetical protein DEV93_00230 [Chloroflexi bacterium]|jgi:uncharacterized cofD-like protein|nr:hypothetical protein [Chloroflexota bacterium]